MTASEYKGARVNSETNRWLLSTITGVTAVKTACTDVYADARIPCPTPPQSRRLDTTLVLW